MKKRRKELCILPQLNDKGGSMNPKKKWYIFYSYLDPRTGKKEPFRESKGFGKIKNKVERYAYAEKRIGELTKKLLSGWNPYLEKKGVLYEDQLQRVDELRFVEAKAAAETFSHFASQFLLEKKKKSRETTIITYRSKLRKFREWLTASNIHDNVSNLTPQVIQDFFSYIIDVKQLSRESVKNYKQLLTIVLDIAVDEEAIADNPVAPHIEGGEEKDMGAYPMSPEDFKKIIDYYREEGETQHCLSLFFEYYCLMRPGHEIRLMRVRWISWGTATITIPAEFSKNRRQRIVTIPNPLLKELKRLNIHQAPTNYYVLGKGDTREPSATHWGKNYFSMKFARTRDKLGLAKQYKLYSGKHTGAIAAEASGIPLSAIMRQAGHSSLNVTTRYMRKTCHLADGDYQSKMNDIT